MITIVLPVSREEYLKKVFASLEMLICDRAKTNLFVYVDGDTQLLTKARNFTVRSKFNQKLCVHRSRGKAPASGVKQRRHRIADVHNEIKKYLNKSDYLLLVEDDTIIPPTSLVKLSTMYSKYPHAGIVTGMELGRWGLPYIGAFKVDDIYEPKEITSIETPNFFDIRSHLEIDTCGFYCAMTKLDTYMKHTFKPFEDSLGPDFDYSLSLRQQGYKNYVETGIKCTHLTPKKELSFSSTEPVQIKLTRGNKEWKLSKV